MNKDAEIRAGLKNSGIPELAFSTTLALEGATELRRLITGKEFIRPSSTRGLYLYPSAPSKAAQARKQFYLTAKELFLSGVSVYCIPLSRLLGAITTDDMDDEAYRVEQVRMVFILDFYEAGAGCPLSTKEAARLRYWVRDRFESRDAVSFLSDTPVDRCAEWYPESFLGFIRDNAIVQSV